MSKNKKLGRGLRELLKQAENQSQINSRIASQNSSTFPDVPRETEEEIPEGQNDDPNSVLDGAEPDHVPEVEEISEETAQTDAIDDDSRFHFDLIRGDLKQAAVEVEELQKELGGLNSQKKSGVQSTSKTLMDYMNQTEASHFSDEAQTRSFSKTGMTGTVSEFAMPANSEPPAGDEVDRIFNIPVSQVDSNPWQPREVFQAKEIGELAESIKTHGLLQPIVVRQFRNRYQLVAGERRFRAAMKLNWTQVPATIIDATDREMAELALIENLQRKDLNPIEKAASFNKYLQENHCTQEELSKRLNLDRSTIANLIRLLSLPAEVQQKVIEEKLTQGHARSLLTLNTTHDQLAMAQRIEDEKLTVRQTEQIVADWNNKPVEERKSGSITKVSAPTSNKRKKEKNANILDLERQLQDALDLKVKITADDSGKGKLEIYFQNQEDFASLMEYFKN